MSDTWDRETIATTHHEWHLEQTTQLVLILYARLGVHEAALIRDGTIASDENIIGDGLAEHFDLEDVCDDLFCLPIDVGVNERDIVVARYNVAERGETLLDALDPD